MAGAASLLALSGKPPPSTLHHPGKCARYSAAAPGPATTENPICGFINLSANTEAKEQNGHFWY